MRREVRSKACPVSESKAVRCYECLITAEDEKVSADLFVDCTGFASILMRKSQGVELECFNSNLFNESAVVAQTQSVQSISAKL
jgi:hypothetical protein